jgi:hypothetical protein
MALLEVNWTPGRRELRQFAGAWVFFFALMAVYGRGPHPTLSVVTGAVAAAGLVGLLRPGLLRPAYVLLMSLAVPIGWIVSHVILAAVYFALMTPIGHCMRLCGYDPLRRTFDRSTATYWSPHDSEGDPARYFKQF